MHLDNSNNTFNFDEDFYLKMYPDLINVKNLKYHYLNHGIHEGRVCNYKQMKQKRDELFYRETDKINKFIFKSNISEIKINIVVRTHLRKENFNILLESIINQKYNNYIVHIIYDHDDSLIYINEYIKSIPYENKFKIYKMYRSSDKDAFFDLYCDNVKQYINDGFIMYLDDDNYFISDQCLNIINQSIDNNKILIWSFLRPDKLIIPNLKDIKYGEIDNCSHIFNNTIKNDSHFGDTYGSDFTFIKGLLDKHQAKQIDYTIVATQYSDQISHYSNYKMSDFTNSYIQLDRIDFNDYKNHYKDLQHLTTEKLKNHYDKCGKYESRIVKFIDFDYDLFSNNINHYNTYYNSNIKFILITTLYNEDNETRLKEYQICLEHHEKNQFIEKIVVFYDNHKGNNEILQKCFNSLSKVELLQCTGRPYFIDLFNYSNQNHEGKNIIICNSDIIFDHTLHKLEHIDFKDKLYALTRWDYIDETTAKPRFQKDKIMNSSKDTWIFKTPLNLNVTNDTFKEIQIGTWNCDGALNHFLKDQIVYECLTIKSYHVHFCNGRSEKDTKIIY